MCAQTKVCKTEGCSRSAAGGFDTCCKQCALSAGTKHGPRCTACNLIKKEAPQSQDGAGRNYAGAVCAFLSPPAIILLCLLGGEVTRKVLTVIACMPVLLVAFGCIGLLYRVVCIGNNSLPIAPRNLELCLFFVIALCTAVLTHPMAWVFSIPVHWWQPVTYLSVFVILRYIALSCEVWYMANPLRWEHVQAELIEGDEDGELEEVQELFEKQCAAYSAKYDFKLELVKAFRVSNTALQDSHQQEKDRLREKHGRNTVENVQRLFHATSSTNARSIVKGGFQLPERNGMFGRGIYFASTPLKSWQYYGWPGAMLVCDVALGASMVKRTAGCEPQKDLQCGWLGRLMGQRSYDSVTAQDGLLGCVRVPEFVVYKPEQAVPRFVLLVRQQR